MQDNQSWKLPQKYYCYKKTLDTLLATKALFQKLFIEYKICFRCIFRMYSFEQTKLYNDTSFCLEILPILLELAPEHDLYKEYNVIQCCMTKICWLCQELFQKSYINRVIERSKESIKDKGYEEWEQFKLNIRIPHVILLKNIILARYIYYEQNKNQTDSALKQSLYNILIFPIEANKMVEPKTIQKWILSTNLCSETQMSSTSEEHYDNLIINLEQEYDNEAYQYKLMKEFSSFLGLQKEKKKEKNKGRKACLDLGQQKEKDVAIHKQEYKCNGFNLNKIIGLRSSDYSQIFDKFQNRQEFLAFLIGDHFTSLQNSFKISLHTRNIYLCGKYIKYSRYLSQTPWIVNGKKLTEGSLQEQIQDKIYKLFYPNLAKQKVQIKFHSGGRQDIDVRMLKGGRPFVLQFLNPIKPIKFVKQSDIVDIIPLQHKEIILGKYQQWKSEQKQDNGSEHHSWRIVKLLQLLINEGNQYVQVLDLQETTESFISVELKAAQTEKIKHYICYIYSMQPFTLEDTAKLDELKDLKLQQITPLRVLHRRTLMFRDKMIHRMRMHLVSVHSAILQVWASAGTYIKQFVHGDLGRTTPNVGYLLNKQIDILQLDVGSLKQGEWKKGDEQLMKMQKFEWMD